MRSGWLWADLISRNLGWRRWWRGGKKNQGRGQTVQIWADLERRGEDRHDERDSGMKLKDEEVKDEDEVEVEDEV